MAVPIIETAAIKEIDTIKETDAIKETDEKVPFNRKQVKLGVAALLAHLKEKSAEPKKKDELFESEDVLWLLLGLKKVPQAEKKPRKIPIPHCFNTSADVCLITKEPAKAVKEKLQKLGITSVNKVISLTKLRKEYKTFTLKRQLLAAFDIFLCDDRIYHFVTKTLGKEFYKRKREPIPICLTYDDWKSEISKSIDCSMLRLGHGPCSAVKVGSISNQSEKQLAENAIHLMKVIGRRIPGSWKNVKCFHLKSSTSVALPVYQSSPLSAGTLGEKLKVKAMETEVDASNVVKDDATEENDIVKEEVNIVKEEIDEKTIEENEENEGEADGQISEEQTTEESMPKRKGQKNTAKTVLKKKKTLK